MCCIFICIFFFVELHFPLLIVVFGIVQNVDCYCDTFVVNFNVNVYGTKLIIICCNTSDASYYCLRIEIIVYSYL